MEKRKKPKFITQDSHKRPEIKDRWRKPKGMHSKMRLRKGGHRRIVSIGYGSPDALRGSTKSGKKIVLLNCIKDLEKITPDSIGLLSGKLGAKKRIEIIKQAIAKKTELLNLKDKEGYLNKIEEEKAKKKEAKKEVKEEKKPEKPKIEETVKTDKEKKEEEKKEMEKILTKKDM